METRQLTPRKQGDLGEADAIAVLTRLGGQVSAPLFCSPDYDLVVDFGQGLLRVQVKTSRCRENERFAVQVATNGGNQSWNRTAKFFDRTRCDLLYVLVADGRRWLIPSAAVDARHTLKLGGNKYSQYELDLSDFDKALDSPRPWGERRSRRAGPDCKFGAFVLSGFDSHLPHQAPSAAADKPLEGGVRTSAIGRTTVSSGHQITIPVGPFRAAETSVGDRIEVTAHGEGRLALKTIHPARVAG